jgi:lysophospholipase L1-like esterase
MSARGRFLSVLVAVVLTLGGLATVGALPAAADSPTVQYVALGDSYAAGTAVGTFPNCPHSSIGYPALLDSEERIHLRANEACSGATTDEVTDSQLSALNQGTRLVTLTVGAANLGLAVVLAACFPTPTQECEGAIQNVLDTLRSPAFRSDLTDLFAEVADEAPRARIVVTGYPHLVEPTAPFPPNLIAALNFATDQLNLTIEAAVADADPDPTRPRIFYVDVVVAFTGHGIGGTMPPPFINAPPSPEAFHPTAAGYVAYRDAISVVLPAEWLDKPKQLV